MILGKPSFILGVGDQVRRFVSALGDFLRWHWSIGVDEVGDLCAAQSQGDLRLPQDVVVLSQLLCDATPYGEWSTSSGR